jgi:hypothetical protein
LAEVFKICHIGKREVDQAKMSNVKVVMADKVLDIYNTNEG